MWMMIAVCIPALALPGESAPETTGTAPIAEPSDLSELAALRAYKSGRLLRDRLDTTSTAVYPIGNSYVPITHQRHTWTVYDGGGAPLSSLDFADKVGDVQNSARLRKKIRGNKRAIIGLLASSAAAMGASLVLFSNVDPYAAPEDYMAASYGAMGAMGASLCLGSASTIPLAKIARLNHVPASWSVDEADHWIWDHNDRLASELGLDPSEVFIIDIEAE